MLVSRASAKVIKDFLQDGNGDGNVHIGPNRTRTSRAPLSRGPSNAGESMTPEPNHHHHHHHDRTSNPGSFHPTASAGITSEMLNKDLRLHSVVSMRTGTEALRASNAGSIESPSMMVHLNHGWSNHLPNTINNPKPSFGGRVSGRSSVEVSRAAKEAHAAYVASNSGQREGTTTSRTFPAPSTPPLYSSAAVQPPSSIAAPKEKGGFARLSCFCITCIWTDDVPKYDAEMTPLQESWWRRFVSRRSPLSVGAQGPSETDMMQQQHGGSGGNLKTASLTSSASRDFGQKQKSAAARQHRHSAGTRVAPLVGSGGAGAGDSTSSAQPPPAIQVYASGVQGGEGMPNGASMYQFSSPLSIASADKGTPRANGDGDGKGRISANGKMVQSLSDGSNGMVGHEVNRTLYSQGEGGRISGSGSAQGGGTTVRTSRLRVSSTHGSATQVPPPLPEEMLA